RVENAVENQEREANRSEALVVQQAAAHDAGEAARHGHLRRRQPERPRAEREHPPGRTKEIDVGQFLDLVSLERQRPTKRGDRSKRHNGPDPLRYTPLPERARDAFDRASRPQYSARHDETYSAPVLDVPSAHASGGGRARRRRLLLNGQALAIANLQPERDTRS